MALAVLHVPDSIDSGVAKELPHCEATKVPRS
jgi:hypothetical protein